MARAVASPVASSITVGQAGDLLVEAFRSGTAVREMLGRVQGPRAHRLVLGVRQDLLPAPPPQARGVRGQQRARGLKGTEVLRAVFCLLRMSYN